MKKLLVVTILWLAACARDADVAPEPIEPVAQYAQAAVARFVTDTPAATPRPSVPITTPTPARRATVSPRRETTTRASATLTARTPNMPIPSSGGITRTPFQTLRETPPSPTAPYRELGTITKIDYVAKTMHVALYGAPVDQLPILSSIDIGTAANPRVTTGNIAIVERIANRYYVTGFQQNAMGSTGTAAAAPVATQLSAPANFTVQIVGSNLVFSWSPVSGAVDYQIYSNTIAGPSGATIYQDVGNVLTYSRALNTSTTGEIITNNPGFETGDFTGWSFPDPTTNFPFFIDSTVKRSGVFSALGGTFIGSGPVPHPQSQNNIVSTQYPIVSSNSYVFSMWAQRPVSGVTHRNINGYVNWYDNNAILISQVSWFAGVPASSWTQYSGILTSPSNATYLSVQIIDQLGVAESNSNIDDISVKGIVPIIGPTSFFAVRAVSSSGQSSPFTAWQQPTQSSHSVGSPTSAHMQISNAAGGDISSNLTTSTGVAKTAQGFTDHGWNVPLISTANPVSETWTYASVSSLTISGDATTRYYSGVRLRLKQGGSYLYFIVTASSLSSNTTTVTVVGMDGATLSNAAITDNYYSMQ